MGSVYYRKIRKVAVLALLSLVASVGPPARADEVAESKAAMSILATHCVACHDEGGRGNLRLDNFNTLKLQERLDVLNKVQDQLFYRMMPPPKADLQLDPMVEHGILQALSLIHI